MKELKVILIVLLIIVPIYGVSRYVDQMTPAWEDAARRQAQHDLEVKAQRDTDQIIEDRRRAEDWTEVQRGFLWVVTLGVAGVIVVGLWSHIDKRREAWARPVDGQYALQTFDQGGQTWVVDPNKSVFGVFGVNQATGQISTDANLVGADRQLTYSMRVQQTRTAAAVMGGDGIRYAATGKFLAGAYERQTRPVEYTQVMDEPDQLPVNWQPLTVVDAFNQSDRFKWIIGQNKTTGELCVINPKQNSHFGIVGSNGTGKTAYVALLLMAYALKYKFRVIVLDGKGGADWSKFRDLVEYSPLDYTNVGDIVGQLYSEYQHRQGILNAVGANSIWEVPKGQAPRPTMILIDEFGAVMDSLKAADRNRYKSVELDLGNLLRLSRGAGMYILPCDQNPTKWPATMRANMPVNICFRLGGNIGNAINEYNLDKLERLGHFQMGGTDYHAWPTYEAIDGLLSTVEYKKPKALLTTQQELQTPKAERPAYSTIDSTIAARGVGKRQKYTPTIDSDDSAINSDLGQNTPENDSTINSTIDSTINSVDSGDSAINKPPLTGKPLAKKEVELVRNTYALTDSINETCRLLWGNWTVSRGKWVKEIINEIQE